VAPDPLRGCAEGTRFEYLYDSGDSWAHEVLVERIHPPNPEFRAPECVRGPRARLPARGRGGPGGYERFLKAIRNPRHREHEEMLHWIGGSFDPNAFDLPVGVVAIARRSWALLGLLGAAFRSPRSSRTKERRCCQADGAPDRVGGARADAGRYRADHGRGRVRERRLSGGLLLVA
jgi:Plasmid pRiA4b ORF-3-like protein